MSRILRNTNIYLLPKVIRVAKVPQIPAKKYDFDKLEFMIFTFTRNSKITITSSSINIFTPQRQFHSDSQKSHNTKEKEKENKELAKAYENPYAGLSAFGKAKEASKDATYLGVIVIGIGVFVYMFYALFGELFSSSSPNGLYSYAYKQCKRNTQIKDILGQPLKGYGETTKRGRRSHVSHIEYIEDGVKCMRMRFYIEGPHNKGTATLEAKQNESKKYVVQFIYVEIGPRVIVVEENRNDP